MPSGQSFSNNSLMVQTRARKGVSGAAGGAPKAAQGAPPTAGLWGGGCVREDSVAAAADQQLAHDRRAGALGIDCSGHVHGHEAAAPCGDSQMTTSYTYIYD